MPTIQTRLTRHRHISNVRDRRAPVKMKERPE